MPQLRFRVRNRISRLRDCIWEIGDKLLMQTERVSTYLVKTPFWIKVGERTLTPLI
jgi:hypothetical protein